MYIHRLLPISPCRSYAYLTVRDRLPTILTKVIDTIHRNKKTFLEQYGEVGVKKCWRVPVRYLGRREASLETNPSHAVVTQDGIEAEKHAISQLSKLRNELQTDKPILALTDGKQDAESWNHYLQRHVTLQGDQGSVSWFKSPWLYVECYMYRRIQEAVWLRWERLLLDNSFSPYSLHYTSLNASLLSAKPLVWFQSPHQWLRCLRRGEDAELLSVSECSDDSLHVFGRHQQEVKRPFSKSTAGAFSQIVAGEQFKHHFDIYSVFSYSF